MAFWFFDGHFQTFLSSLTEVFVRLRKLNINLNPRRVISVHVLLPGVAEGLARTESLTKNISSDRAHSGRAKYLGRYFVPVATSHQSRLTRCYDGTQRTGQSPSSVKFCLTIPHWHPPIPTLGYHQPTQLAIWPWTEDLGEWRESSMSSGEQRALITDMYRGTFWIWWPQMSWHYTHLYKVCFGGRIWNKTFRHSVSHAYIVTTMTIVWFLVLWEKPCMERPANDIHGSIELRMKPYIWLCINP